MTTKQSCCYVIHIFLLMKGSGFHFNRIKFIFYQVMIELSLTVLEDKKIYSFQYNIYFSIFLITFSSGINVLTFI